MRQIEMFLLSVFGRLRHRLMLSPIFAHSTQLAWPLAWHRPPPCLEAWSLHEFCYLCNPELGQS